MVLHVTDYMVGAASAHNWVKSEPTVLMNNLTKQEGL